jgi:hypothetical protein
VTIHPPVEVMLAALIRGMAREDMAGSAPALAKRLIVAARAQLTEALIETVLARYEEPSVPSDVGGQERAADAQSVPVEEELARLLAKRRADEHADAMARIKWAKEAGLIGRPEGRPVPSEPKKENANVDQDFS